MSVKSRAYISHEEVELLLTKTPQISKRYIWVTDPHLEFCNREVLWGWAEKIKNRNPSGLLISGDICTAYRMEEILLLLDSQFEFPIYFVLGNHDFYRGSIQGVCDFVSSFCKTRPKFVFLDESEPIALSSKVGLIGHSGWADGKAGNRMGSNIGMNDFLLIQDFIGLDKFQRLDLMENLANKAIGRLDRVLPKALEEFQKAIVILHTPPFIEAAWHRGNRTDPDHLPYFSSPSIGDAIKEHALKYNDREIVVLCGHTHSGGVARILQNLTVYAGSAEYKQPRVHGEIVT